MNADQPTHLKRNRVDIQALRGMAVLMVVLYHTKMGAVAAGYLGVDIFFVISGFLITTLVASGLERGHFRLMDFYFRRAKRLLPAAYVTFAVTAILAPWFLNQQELRDLATQIVGAVTFTGNFVLWQQTGYFEGSGDLKPLLHVWSLAVEEQYYFLLPAALLFTRPSRWLSGAMALVLISLGLCILGGLWKPVATFYLLPTRAWELLIGSVGALWVLRRPTLHDQLVMKGIALLFLPSLCCLLVLPFLPFKGAHPGINAFLVCLATLIVILRNSPWLNSSLPARLLARIGDISYSLYLVHWPIIAFINNAWVDSNPEISMRWRLIALVLSFVLATLLYRWVEDPIRRRQFNLSKSVVGKLGVTSALLMSIAPIAMHARPSHTDFSELRKFNAGLAPVCGRNAERYERNNECQTGQNPSLLIWGDSYAMHLVPGLAQEMKADGVIQATKSLCGPFLNLAPREIIHRGNGTVMDLSWAKQCIAFNQSVLDFIRSENSIKTVVLSSSFTAYVNKENSEYVIQNGRKVTSWPVSTALALESLQRTVGAIQAMGKKVVLIAPTPQAGFNIGGCLERQMSGTIILGGRSDCVIDRTDYLAKRSDVLTLLNAIEDKLDVAVIRFEPWLCNTNACQTFLDDTIIYRDTGHLSYAGSRLLAKRMQLAHLIQTQAK